MLEWLTSLITWLFRSKADEHQVLRAERDALREDLIVVLAQYQKMNQELQDRIEALEERYAVLEAALDKEKKAHGECQKKLAAHEKKIDKLQAQVQQLIEVNKRDG